ncbi:unnamed protein product [Prunus armeniaca]
MHRQEVPLVNAFLTRVKMDAGELTQTKATNFSNRVEKTAFEEMYLTLARENKEVELARLQMKTAKATTVEA